MRILSQNILKCNVKTCRSASPALSLQVFESEIIERPFNQQLIRKCLERCDYASLLKTTVSCGDSTLPPELTDEFLNNAEALRNVHNILLQFHVVKGQLLCELCKRVYKIESGIPNMLLDQSEVD